MTIRPDLDDKGETLTIEIPLHIRKRGGRKLVISPGGTSAWTAPRVRVDNAMVKALAHAYHWREMLETGEHVTIRDIANAEGINDSYVSRVLRLTLLAPDIVDAIVDGRHPANLTLGKLTKPFAVEWRAQRSMLT